jgi:hypothetical protein
MITLENLGKTTRLTVCNYDSYQGNLHGSPTQDKRKPNASSLKQECKEEKEYKNKIIFDFKKSLLDNGVSEENAIEWLKHRKAAKASNSQKAFNTFINQVEKTNYSVNDCVEICLGYKVRNGKVWTGFQASWINNINTDSDYKKAGDFNYSDKY